MAKKFNNVFVSYHSGVFILPVPGIEYLIEPPHSKGSGWQHGKEHKPVRLHCLTEIPWRFGRNTPADLGNLKQLPTVNRIIFLCRHVKRRVLKTFRQAV